MAITEASFVAIFQLSLLRRLCSLAPVQCYCIYSVVVEGGGGGGWRCCRVVVEGGGNGGDGERLIEN